YLQSIGSITAFNADGGLVQAGAQHLFVVVSDGTARREGHLEGVRAATGVARYGLVLDHKLRLIAVVVNTARGILRFQIVPEHSDVLIGLVGAGNGGIRPGPTGASKGQVTVGR